MASEEHLRLEVENVDLRRLLAQAGICAAEQKSRKAVAALGLRGIAPSGEEHVGHCDGDYLEASGCGVPAGVARTATIDLTEETLARRLSGTISSLSVWPPVVQAPLALTPAPSFSPK
jgi:hypothetical protein